MADSVFLAGAAGAIGRCLAPRLVAAGWRVVGTTRRAERAAEMEKWGVTPVVVDVYDAAALARAVAEARPLAVIHQLTDLQDLTDPALLEATLAANARLREEGTRNLIAAATAAGAQRLIAQSISFVYAPGPRPYREDAPLDSGRPDAGITVRGVASLEAQVMAAPLHGIVLRYGRLYGPGTGVAAAPKDGPLHVEAAADAAVLALTRGAPGVYNIAEDDGFVDVSKAARLLGWRP